MVADTYNNVHRTLQAEFESDRRRLVLLLFVYGYIWKFSNKPIQTRTHSIGRLPFSHDRSRKNVFIPSDNVRKQSRITLARPAGITQELISIAVRAQCGRAA